MTTTNHYRILLNEGPVIDICKRHRAVFPRAGFCIRCHRERFKAWRQRRRG